MIQPWGLIKPDSYSNSTYQAGGNRRDCDAKTISHAGVYGVVVLFTPSWIMLERVLSHREYDYTDTILVCAQTFFLISSCFCIRAAANRLKAKPASDEEALLEEEQAPSKVATVCLGTSGCCSVISSIAFTVLLIIRVNEIFSSEPEG